MVEFLFGPAWFNGTDILIDLLSVIVLFLIGLFSFRFYKINPTKKNYKQLGISFFIISLSFAFKILTNFTIYYNVIETHRVGLMALTYNETGALLYRILT
jgi:TRAP-type C4-dicarboxylate transport system permease small subunit